MLPYTERGTGKPILLFLHFFGSSSREWRHVIERLSITHHCVAADMPGFGSAREVKGYSVAEMAAQVDDLVRSFAPAPIVLIGHSMSGKAAMLVGANPPGNLASLILVAPSPLQPEPMTDEARAAMRTANTTRDRAEKFVKNGTVRALSDDDLALGVEDVLRAHADAWLAWPDSGSREDWSDRITSLQVPTTIIAGESDKVIPLDFLREHTEPLAEDSGGKLIVIEDAGHLLPEEATAEVAAAIADTVGRRL